MTKQRFIQSIKANILKGNRRTKFMRSVFAGYGEYVRYFPRIMPLYPELIKFGNNIVVASGVNFITHDAIHYMLDKCHERMGSINFKEMVGCIEIGDNVFIGANSTIMYNVCIGSNTIIGTGTLVLYDLEGDGVYAGIPARKVGTFSDFYRERVNNKPPFSLTKTQFITKVEKDDIWGEYYKNHKKG